MNGGGVDPAVPEEVGEVDPREVEELPVKVLSMRAYPSRTIPATKDKPERVTEAKGFAEIQIETLAGAIKIPNISVKMSKGNDRYPAGLRMWLPGEWSGEPGSKDRKFRPAVIMSRGMFERVQAIVLEAYHAEVANPSDRGVGDSEWAY